MEAGRAIRNYNCGCLAIPTMPLTLSLSGLSVTFNKFTSNEYPRITVQLLSVVEFSALGTPAISGTHHQAKYLWQFQAICDRTQRHLVEAIAHEFHTRRRNLEECDILVLDTTAYITERSPRTREIVPGAIETSINGGTWVAYHAQFLAAITDGPTFATSGTNGRVDVLSMSLTETVRTKV